MDTIVSDEESITFDFVFSRLEQECSAATKEEAAELLKSQHARKLSDKSKILAVKSKTGAERATGYTKR